MTALSATTRRPATRRSSVGFRQAARMEWIKLGTLRSPWVTLVITVAGVAGLATAVGFNSKDTHGDITSNVLAGVAPGLLAFGVLGVLVMTNEYSSGLITVTLAAVPHRGTLLAAKTAVFGAVALRGWRGRPRSQRSLPERQPCLACSTHRRLATRRCCGRC